MTDDRQKMFAQLSAYLDGELSREEARRISDALAKDELLRREFEELQETRNLLRKLPKEAAPEGMLEAILQEAERERLLPSGGDSHGARSIHWLRHLATAAIVLLTLGGGFYIYSITAKHGALTLSDADRHLALRQDKGSGRHATERTPLVENPVANEPLPATPAAQPGEGTATEPVRLAKAEPAAAGQPKAGAEPLQDMQPAPPDASPEYGQVALGSTQVVMNCRNVDDGQREVAAALEHLGIQMPGQPGPDAAGKVIQRSNSAYIAQQSPARKQIVVYVDRPTAVQLATTLNRRNALDADAAMNADNSVPPPVPAAQVAPLASLAPKSAPITRGAGQIEPTQSKSLGHEEGLDRQQMGYGIREAEQVTYGLPESQPATRPAHPETVGELTRVVITINAAPAAAESEPATQPQSRPASEPSAGR